MAVRGCCSPKGEQLAKLLIKLQPFTFLKFEFKGDAISGSITVGTMFSRFVLSAYKTGQYQEIYIFQGSM